MSVNEIAAATEVVLGEFNAQHQPQIEWTPSFAVVRSHFDQAVRNGLLDDKTARKVAQFIDKAEKLDTGPASKRAVIAQLTNAARQSGDSAPALTAALLEFADTFRD